MAQRIYVIIAEPSAIIRCGVAALLQRLQSVSVEVAELSDISALSTMTMRTTPDLLIINPSYAGQLSMSQLKAETGNEKLKIVALQSTFVDPNTLQNYDCVISLYDSAEALLEKIIDIVKEEDIDATSKKELSSREKEIIVCVVKGMTNKLIADTLSLSTHTVIAHRRNIANKLQIHSPSGLTIYAIVNKLVDLSEIKNSIFQSKEGE
ncbi:MAG: LuxR C-terminal-related transcriptional regulator [Rikenellaceae bacterium]